MDESDAFSLVEDQCGIRKSAYWYLFGGMLVGAAASVLGACYRPSTPARKIGKRLMCAGGLGCGAWYSVMGIGALHAAEHVTTEAGAETAMGPVLVTISAPEVIPISEYTVYVERWFHVKPNWAFWRKLFWKSS